MNANTLTTASSLTAIIITAGFTLAGVVAGTGAALALEPATGAGVTPLDVELGVTNPLVCIAAACEDETVECLRDGDCASTLGCLGSCHPGDGECMNSCTVEAQLDFVKTEVGVCSTRATCLPPTRAPAPVGLAAVVTGVVRGAPWSMIMGYLAENTTHRRDPEPKKAEEAPNPFDAEARAAELGAQIGRRVGNFGPAEAMIGPNWPAEVRASQRTAVSVRPPVLNPEAIPTSPVACLATACANDMLMCVLDNNCSAALGCAVGCGAGDLECIARCSAPRGVNLLENQLGTCAFRAQCGPFVDTRPWSGTDDYAGQYGTAGFGPPPTASDVIDLMGVCGDGVCGPLEDGASCMADCWSVTERDAFLCAAESCSGEMNRCAGDAECGQALACVGECPPWATDCVETCGAKRGLDLRETTLGSCAVRAGCGW